MNNLTTWFLNSENQQVSENITDVPPITFNSNGEPLTNWKITGSQAGVGDATINLFDSKATLNGYKLSMTGELNEDDSYFVSDYIPCEASDTFFLSIDYIPNAIATIGLFDKDKNYINFGIKVIMGSTLFPAPIRITLGDFDIDNEEAKYFRISVSNTYKNIMITKTSAAQEYEPYGYKIPVKCGNTITNIYMDEPLYEEDSIGYKDTKIKIPTTNGENELSIGTTNAPTSVFIQTNGVSRGFRDYFKTQTMINND